MNECVVCGKECTGVCCSGACRAKLSRRTVDTVQAHAHGSARTQAHGLNMAELSTPEHRVHSIQQLARHEVDRAGRANNTMPPLPGDDDYTGVCHNVDGKWQVKPEYQGPLTPASIQATVVSSRAKQMAG